MAKCEKRVIQPEPPPVEYVLTLSAEEARQLYVLLAQSSYSEARAAICQALSGAGAQS